MREVLFRGKSSNNLEWVYGSYVYRTNYYRDPDDSHFILIGGEFDCDYYDGELVEPETVGQWTGLVDKNGVKIFEGDVMVFDAYGFHYKGVVSFVDGNFCVMCNRPTASPFLDSAIKQHDAICVGNIYDSKELLEGGSDE